MTTNGAAPQNLQALADIPRWVAWRADTRADGKTTKVPYRGDGKPASSNKPEHWGTRAEATEWAAALVRPDTVGGVGIMFGKLDPNYSLGGVDLDTCRDPITGNLQPWAAEIVERLPRTYWEVSPSREGLKGFFVYRTSELPDLRQAAGITGQGGCAWKGVCEEGHGPGIELYLTGRYFTVTDDLSSGTTHELGCLDAASLRWLAADAGPRMKQVTSAAPAAPVEAEPEQVALVETTIPTPNLRDTQERSTEAPDDEAALRKSIEDWLWLNPVLERCWRGNWETKDNSRSARAMALGGALRRSGFNFNEMCRALAMHTDTAAWVREKGVQNRGRELERIWEKSAPDIELSAGGGGDTLNTAPSDAETPAAKDNGYVSIFEEDWDTWVDADIPQRPWLVPGFLMRGAVTIVAGDPAAGKSALTVAWCVASALGRPFGSFVPPEGSGLKIMVVNAEDDHEEQRRRFGVALRQFSALPGDIKDRIGRVQVNGVANLLKDDGKGGVVATPAFHNLLARMEARLIDTLVLDPLVEMHTCEENDNARMRDVVAILRTVARRYNIAVLLLHHFRKGGNGQPGSLEVIRGAGSIGGAIRAAFTVCTMTKEEAGALGVPEERHKRYFRLDNAKSNYTALQDAEWFERISSPVGNGEDTVAVVPWTPPKDNPTEVDLAGIERDCEKGSPEGPWLPRIVKGNSCC